LLRLDLEFLYNWGMGAESLFRGAAQLLGKDGIGGNTFFFDKLFDNIESL